MDKLIVTDPQILSGKPSIAGTRIPVSLIVNLLDHGYDVARVIQAYPILTERDVRAAVEYAAGRPEEYPSPAVRHVS